MSDIRFTLIGVAFVFAGFIVLGVFGGHYYDLAIQAETLGSCYEYRDGIEVEVDCDVVYQDRSAFFALVIALIGAGVFFLIKGIRGRWDQDVRPEEKIGPDSSFPS